MFFEMNLSWHPPVRKESEHKTDREVKKQPLESILRRIQHEPFSKRQVWRELPGNCGTVWGICQSAGQSPLPLSQRPAPSLLVADDHYYCFACGAHGDVIDFAANFFALPLYEAAQWLAADFGIDTDRPPTKEILEKRRQQTEAQQLMENERLCFSVLSDHARVLRRWKVQYAPSISRGSTG